MIGDGAGDLQAGAPRGVKTGLVFAPNRCELCPMRGGPAGLPGRIRPTLREVAHAILRHA
jgi:D-glycero-D-manno-heptose 1,7-bisphosphate phosphatase